MAASGKRRACKSNVAYAATKLSGSAERRAPAPGAASEALRVQRINLSGRIWAEVERGVGDVSVGKRSVRVEFPDCARSTLETMAWGSRLRIADVVARIAVEYLDGRAVLAFERNSVDTEARPTAPVASVPVLALPFGAFRSTLEAICQSRAATPATPESKSNR
jgi:hypothetical protein